jgi:hypothetical protein
MQRVVLVLLFKIAPFNITMLINKQDVYILTHNQYSISILPCFNITLHTKIQLLLLFLLIKISSF